MRIPFTKVYRAFPEFDSLPDEDCESFVIAVRGRRQELVAVAPTVVAVVLVIVWPVAWALLWNFVPGLDQYVPLPGSDGGKLLLLTATTVAVPGFAALLVRDVGLWISVRDEVNRARCPRCRQSLLGVPVQEIGAGDDPSKRFIRCPECGKKYNLLDIGITIRDLVPFEKRAVPTEIRKKE